MKSEAKKFLDDLFQGENFDEMRGFYGCQTLRVGDYDAYYLAYLFDDGSVAEVYPCLEQGNSYSDVDDFCRRLGIEVDQDA